MSELESILKELNETNPNILLSIVVSPDGLVIAHEGSAQDPDKVAALYIELQLVCEKIMNQLDYGELEEIFIRSASGCVTILPVFDKGILACMSTPDVNSGVMQLVTWKAVNRLGKVM
ncbi:MAG: roadblock/LC7 domain-containing protein [Thiohalophilus sp.]|jgi:predicted regulator of Ras-like GTPase activity (Roadblock/LC7/MglB family)